MTRSKLYAMSYSTLAVLAFTLAAPADAGWWRCHKARRGCAPPVAVATPTAFVVPSPAAIVMPPPQAIRQALAAPADPGGFLARLNATRAAAGLGPVGWSPELAADAAQNSAMGFGHAHLGRARRQNAGVGDLGAVWSAWLTSPAHASALLDPRSTECGLACVGGVWTYSGN